MLMCIQEHILKFVSFLRLCVHSYLKRDRVSSMEALLLFLGQNVTFSSVLFPSGVNFQRFPSMLSTEYIVLWEQSSVCSWCVGGDVLLITRLPNHMPTGSDWMRSYNSFLAHFFRQKLCLIASLATDAFNATDTQASISALQLYCPHYPAVKCVPYSPYFHVTGPEWFAINFKCDVNMRVQPQILSLKSPIWQSLTDRGDGEPELMHPPLSAGCRSVRQGHYDTLEWSCSLRREASSANLILICCLSIQPCLPALLLTSIAGRRFLVFCAYFRLFHVFQVGATLSSMLFTLFATMMFSSC